MAHYITRRGLSIVAFWHLLSPRRRLDLAASHRPLPCPVALLSSPSFAPAMHRNLGHWPACQASGSGLVCLFTVSPLGPPSRASTGRQSTAWATQTARPTSALDRAAPTASVAGWGGQAASSHPLWGGRKAARHVQRLPRPTSQFTPATATKEVASAAQMKPVRLVWEPHAVPLSPALLTTPKPTPRNPSRPSLTSWWLASTEASSFLTPCPRSNSRRPTSDHKKGPRVLRGPASD
ncbi:hypothetical protein EMIHUDRAFT_444811 [Emiliania huxleyi CCMP1516]|uniref:Uncharacterized protein n=2 Tax=Emiliania huxleyi TaxID=2903 RepID=A0A0D3J8L1_EMIH1|nr:hypothetical protein EMIHUDRAFT_444811 [Emiliania huxleyi CCMP1516]EOD19846.1 hypothetical protein EMIHUDRAFT_444811 [Emiliania huxleyi CCMP1516]|eukprot:XP_005772275.1 hypothetical protein EMIHUDRAFT_444811 [Emiliania huxleyi CCMP1516]